MQDTHISGRHNVILLGDSLGDANMDGGIPYNTVLRIGFLNSDLVIKYLHIVLNILFFFSIYKYIYIYFYLHWLQIDHEDAYLQQYKLAFDIVLVQDQSMGLLNYLLDEIIGLKSTSVCNNK